jgi:hypothetical protein
VGSTKLATCPGRTAGLAEGRTAVRARMASSCDEQQLLRWLDRAVTAASAEELFDDSPG